MLLGSGFQKTKRRHLASAAVSNHEVDGKLGESRRDLTDLCVPQGPDRAVRIHAADLPWNVAIREGLGMSVAVCARNPKAVDKELAIQKRYRT